MNRRSFVKGTAAALGTALADQNVPAQSARGAGSRPNVLFILPDEWRGQALGCMGNADVRTPNLDRLASEGTLFKNTLANTPVCCPARANILTGTYTNRNGMIANDLRLRESVVSLADLYAQAGYKTAFIGKWHLDGGPRLPGFVPPGARRHGFQFWAAHECNHNYFYNWYFRDENVPIIVDKYEPEFWTDLAIEFLCEAQDEPFFLMLAPGAPHDPYIAPQQYSEMYQPEKLKVPPNWIEGVHGASRKDLAGYYAAITAIDDQVGRLLRVLKELDREKETIVLFSSDHGNMLGSQGKILKRKPWEESIRVPGIMRCPGVVPAGRKTEALFSHVDFAPTLLSLCGLSVPNEMQGTNLAGLVRGETGGGKNSAYFQIFGPFHGDGTEQGWRAVRTQRYMYARTKTEPWLLYDLQSDPFELKNLAADPASIAIARDLDQQLNAWMSQVGDSWDLDWTEPLEDGGRLFTYKAFYTLPEYRDWAKKHPNLAQTSE
jgi:arylsulfatase A-like enzyme